MGAGAYFLGMGLLKKIETVEPERPKLVFLPVDKLVGPPGHNNYFGLRLTEQCRELIGQRMGD